jgi:CBS domain containing-hemolysin-like protein
MEWIADPSAWMGLATLIVLELVLGIDNLVFIAILADKLPPHQRDKARMIGLSLALVMRLGLLASISWLVTLTEPLFEVFGHGFSGRDLILLGGGLFLLFKATMELHERLEGSEHRSTGKQVFASFGVVIAQIVVLDAVFSLDSVITAVGMVDHLAVMMIAVIFAMILMMVASKPLTRFVSAHPTLIILCLGLLLMIGFSLVAEGMGFHIPKGYLYAAIGFAIVIETFNQVASANRRKVDRRRPFRDRTADAVLRMLGGRVEYGAGEPALQASGASAGTGTDASSGEDLREMFQPAERSMIQGVLTLAERPVTSIMTPRTDVDWIDLGDPAEQVRRELVGSPYSRVVAVRDGRSDDPLGILQKKDLLPDLLAGQDLDLDKHVLQPPVLPEFATVLAALERFKREPLQLAFVVDEFGSFIGLVTATDVMEAIAGELPDEHEPVSASMVRTDDGGWQIDGRTSLDELRDRLDLTLPEDVDYHTAAGLVLDALGSIPAEGEGIDIGEWRFTVTAMSGNRIESLVAQPRSADSTVDG